MKLVFVYGLPAAGKLTVSRELAKLTGYKLFHNHLTVDLLCAVFDFGSPSFIELREQIWLSVFAHARRGHLPGMIFTFSPERTVNADFVSRVALENDVLFVELRCPADTLKRRMSDASRLRHGKLTSVPFFEQLQAEGAFDVSCMPSPHLSIDTSTCTPEEAAVRIARMLPAFAPESEAEPTP